MDPSAKCHMTPWYFAGHIDIFWVIEHRRIAVGGSP
jgi:hypothetical protein